MTIVRFEEITRHFPGVRALDRVTLEVERASVHGLVGENGAGKSTLGKVLAGIHPPDGGRLIVDGRPVRFASPLEALQAGIGIVHQELAFCENLSVAENLCLDALPARGLFLARGRLVERARELLAPIAPEIDVTRRIGELPISARQLVQIAAAVGRGARVIVFDEPTSSLSEREARRLHALIREVRERGVACLYISHRLGEVQSLCDRISVLRDGRHVGTLDAAQASEDELVRLMIGRELAEYFPAHLSAPPGPVRLAVRGLSSPGRFAEVSFELRAGEVLGLAGLVGSGRSEVAEAIFGLDPRARGEVSVGGAVRRIGAPHEAIALGLGLVPEDRKRSGLVLSMSARANLTLPVLGRIARLGWINAARERALVAAYFARLSVRGAGPEALAGALSGGNQQKIVLARWLAAQCGVLLLDEPTRGVDVGAKAEIHALIGELARSGAAVLMISSELPEVLNLSNRVLVLRAGRVVAELPRAAADQETVMRAMAGL